MYVQMLSDAPKAVPKLDTNYTDGSQAKRIVKCMKVDPTALTKFKGNLLGGVSSYVTMANKRRKMPISRTPEKR